MAAKQPAVGIAHPTVVPADFVREGVDPDDDPNGNEDDADT